jgi:hypothetical protein
MMLAALRPASRSWRVVGSITAAALFWHERLIEIQGNRDVRR